MIKCGSLLAAFRGFIVEEMQRNATISGFPSIKVLSG